MLNRRDASAKSRNSGRELRALERTSPFCWSDLVKMVKLLGHHPNTVRRWDFVPSKTFPRYKTNQQSNLGWVKTFSWYQIRDLNNRCDQILFTASLVITLTWMLIWSPRRSVPARSGAGAIRSPGIRRRPARHVAMFWLILDKPQPTGLRNKSLASPTL